MCPTNPKESEKEQANPSKINNLQLDISETLSYLIGSSVKRDFFLEVSVSIYKLYSLKRIILGFNFTPCCFTRKTTVEGIGTLTPSA